ncbi:MAG TPA: hypothetical protein VK327_14465 [Candidatus Paceibacterota bacterium]|nr:hypothetical protein [Candidatus Paceibacterota bacterium]
MLIDSERESSGVALAKDRAAFIADCEALKFKVHTTEKRAFENYLSDQAIKEEKGISFRALADFERLKDLPNGWSKGDNWRIARCMSREDVLATDIGKFLDEI